MIAIKFHAVVRDGMIPIPLEYQAQFMDGAHVILMSDTSGLATDNLLEHLLAHPVTISGFRPLTRDEAHVR